MSGWNCELLGQPDYGYARITIPDGETLKLEASSMATMTTNIKMKTKMRGGLGRFLTGESLFINEFTAQGGDGVIGVAPGSPGQIIHHHLENSTVYLSNSCYLANSPGVEVSSKWQGMIKGFFGGQGLFLCKASGLGDLWFTCFGSLIEVEVNGPPYIVDNGHIVAFTEGLDYEITKLGGYKSLFFSGEGLVCRFSGTGKVWVQSRSVPAFVTWINPFRRVEKRNNN